MAGTEVKPNDLLLNITGGSIGRCCCVPDQLGEANVSQHVAIIRPVLGGLSPFMHRLVLSPYFQAFVFGEQTGAGRGGLPKNRMDRIPVALPLAEQSRIVAKVDELIALCDRLEAAQKERESRRDRLVSASLARLNQPADLASFREHVRFHLRHLPQMTTRSGHIERTRQAVLETSPSEDYLLGERKTNGPPRTSSNILPGAGRHSTGKQHPEAQRPARVR
jgi:type I restriction enzyme S subunit